MSGIIDPPPEYSVKPQKFEKNINTHQYNNDENEENSAEILFVIVTCVGIMSLCVFGVFVVNRMSIMENQVATLEFIIKKTTELSESMVKSAVVNERKKVGRAFCDIYFISFLINNIKQINLLINILSI